MIRKTRDIFDRFEAWHISFSPADKERVQRRALRQRVKHSLIIGGRLVVYAMIRLVSRVAICAKRPPVVVRCKKGFERFAKFFFCFMRVRENELQKFIIPCVAVHLLDGVF